MSLKFLKFGSRKKADSQKKLLYMYYWMCHIMYRFKIFCWKAEKALKKDSLESKLDPQIYLCRVHELYVKKKYKY